MVNNARVSPATSKTTAVIVGGSMAGSMAAQQLSKYFDRVIVLEKDAAMDTVEDRKGVPQYRQPHVLLLKGMSVLEGLFPGFKQQMYAAGAEPLDIGKDQVINYAGEWTMPYTWGSEELCVGATRHLVESTVRNFLRMNPKVEIKTNAAVARLQYNADTGRCTGVELKCGDVIAADLVVDATGRSSKMQDWLEDLGLSRAPEVSINAKMVYATCTVKPRSAVPRKLLSCFSPPSQAVVIPVEGGLYQVILCGPKPPKTNRESYIEWAYQNLLHPYVAEFLDDCDFVTDCQLYARTGNVLRQYDKCPGFPEGVVVVGDAFAALNPIYGQGISCSSVAVELLGEVLQKKTGGRTDAAAIQNAIPGLSKSFHAQLAKELAFPWSLATGSDLKIVPEQAKTKSWAERMVDEYVDNFIKTSLTRPDMHRQVMRVMQMVEKPNVLFTVGNMYKVWAAPKPNQQAPATVKKVVSPVPHYTFMG